MSQCSTKLAWRNPLGSADIHIDCAKEEHLSKVAQSAAVADANRQHEGRWLNTLVSWLEGDRREYTGEFPGWCAHTEGCVLPRGHSMAGSGCQT